MTTQHASTARVPWQAKFLALALIWGSSFLLMKYGLRALAPLQISTLRIFCGALILLGLLRLTGGRLPRERWIWGHLLVSGIFLTAFPFTAFVMGETRVSSALAGIGNSITPISMVIFGLLLLPGQPTSRDKLVAVAIGFLGVVVITEPWAAAERPDLLGFGITLAGGASYGVGWTYNRRFLGKADLGGLSQPTALLLCGSALMVPVIVVWSLVTGTAPWAAQASGSTLAIGLLATMALGVVGTGLAYMLQYDVVRAAGPVVSGTVTYLIPAVAVTLGVVVLGERLDWPQLVGFALVLIAALIVGRPAGGWRSLLRRAP